VIESQGLAGSLTMTTPYYRRIMDDIKARITAGTLSPGDRLPSTRELAADFDTAPGTVRTAINLLIELGWLRGHQGLGVFVADDPPIGGTPPPADGG
jgi:GntR family transcriptional regulator